jgi:release factor H-coupled RctB family protein
VFVLTHSGSRALGYSVFERLMGEGIPTLNADSEEGERYLREHDHAVRWARLNRIMIAERAAEAVGVGSAGCQPIANLPHNYLERCEAGFLHRKGAAPANRGLVPIPGSRESLSYLVSPNPVADPSSLATLAHGAGRKYDRGAMHGRIQKVKSVREQMRRNPFGGIVVCEDRNLMIEEAGAAYKNIDRVIDQLVDFGLVTLVATFRPLITFKTGMAHIGRRDEDRR